MNNLDWNARTPRTQSRQKQKRQGGIQDWKETTAEEAPLATSEDLELDSMSDGGDINDDEETGLTEQDKRKRRRKRNRNSRMDQRIIGESSATAEEKKEANQAVLKKMLINCLLISLW
jgi:solute carrier family 35 protein C2